MRQQKCAIYDTLKKKYDAAILPPLYGDYGQCGAKWIFMFSNSLITNIMTFIFL